MPFITEATMYAALSNSVANSQTLLLAAQAQASSGLRVGAPGDDPSAAAQGTVLQGSIAALQAMGAAASEVTHQLSMSDQSMQSAQGILARAKELSVQAATAGVGATERSNIAQEVQTLGQSLLAIANTQDHGTYIFAGFASGQQPFAADGTYAGDSGVRNVEVAPGLKVGMNIPGSQIWNVAGGQNIIGVFASLAQHLESNDVAGVQSDISNLDGSITQLSNAQAVVGSMLEQTRNAEPARQSIENLMRTSRSATVEVDAAQALSNMMQAQSAYQSAIAEASRILATLGEGLLRR